MNFILKVMGERLDIFQVISGKNCTVRRTLLPLVYRMAQLGSEKGDIGQALGVGH